MKIHPIPLSERVKGALALQPMTQADLARCLSCSYSAVAHIVEAMHEDREVRIVGRSKRRKAGRPQWLWNLALPVPAASLPGRSRKTGHLGVYKSIACD